MSGLRSCDQSQKRGQENSSPGLCNAPLQIGWKVRAQKPLQHMWLPPAKSKLAHAIIPQGMLVHVNVVLRDSSQEMTSSTALIRGYALWCQHRAPHMH